MGGTVARDENLGRMKIKLNWRGNEEELKKKKWKATKMKGRECTRQGRIYRIWEEISQGKNIIIPIQKRYKPFFPQTSFLFFSSISNTKILMMYSTAHAYCNHITHLDSTAANDNAVTLALCLRQLAYWRQFQHAPLPCNFVKHFKLLKYK
jgi:hypothetical protein